MTSTLYKIFIEKKNTKPTVNIKSVVKDWLFPPKMRSKMKMSAVLISI